MLDSLAAPKVWAVGGDSKVEVFTSETARAQELISLHKALQAPVVDTDARLEALRALQRQAAAYDCMLTRDLLDLSEREVDLLRRGRPPESMSQLRKRCAGPKFLPTGRRGFRSHGTVSFGNSSSQQERRRAEGFCIVL